MKRRLSASQVVNRAYSEGLLPPPDLTLWEWSDQNRILATDSDDQGRYRSERTPYVRGIAECLSPSHPARDITIMKGSQLGLTTLGINWIGYIVDLMPAPLLITLPSEGVAREWSTQRLAQLVEETKSLRGKIQEASKRRSGNTTFSKKFSGGYFMKIAWSSSAAKLRSTPAKFLLSDEVDGFEGDTEGEGDPLYLLNRRSTNFQGAKHFKISTPTDARSSRIHREFLLGDQRFYFIPCPLCGHYQVIRFPRLRWERGRPETVALLCAGCDRRIEERHKTAFLERGVWVATVSCPALVETGFRSLLEPRIVDIQRQMDEAERVTFHLNSYYSPLGWYSWRRASEEWEAALKDPKQQKVYVMTVMGETWNNLGDAPKWESLYERRKTDYNLGEAPAGVLFITVGVDVQSDRLELEIVGWGRDLRSWSIAYERIDGTPDADATWRKLDERLAGTITHASGAELPIWVVSIDSGNWANRVYEAVARHNQPQVSPAAVRILRPRTWIATKGGHGFSRLLESVSSEDAARKRGGVKVFTIGTGFAKLEWYEWLASKPFEVDGVVQTPPGYVEFPDHMPAWFQGIVSERLVITTGGVRKFVLDTGVRNEPLDIRLMARLGAHLMVPAKPSARDSFWERLESELMLDAPPPKAASRLSAAVPARANVDRGEPPQRRKLVVPKPIVSEGGWI